MLSLRDNNKPDPPNKTYLQYGFWKRKYEARLYF